ncbi:MAG: hypothetical protein ACQEQN_00050 [Thermodesulfobacteriota bacterium]
MNDEVYSTDNILMETIALDDNITLKLFDDSTRLPDDNWQVTLTARLEIPIDTLYRSERADLPRPDELRNALGDPLVYEHKNVRQFVPAKEKQALLESLIGTFKANVFPYIARPDFHVNYAAVAYREHAKRKTWYPDEPQGS